MVALTLLLTSVIFQIIPEKVVADEILNPVVDDQFLARMQLTKRYVGSLAKNKQLPTVQQRSYAYFVPPLISTYGNQRPTSVDDRVAKDKRYLGALARTGDLNFSKPQQKKAVDFVQSGGADDERPPSSSSSSVPEEDGEFSLPSRDDLPDPTLMKREMIAYLEPIILGYLNEFNRTYDRSKVDLFLTNLVNAIFDQTEGISIEKLKTLVQSNYFHPEDVADDFTTEKRNLQALLRQRNIARYMEAARAHQTQSKLSSDTDRQQLDSETAATSKRNLQSLIKNKSHKRHLGSVAKMYGPRAGAATIKRSVEGMLDYLSAIPTPYDDDEEYTASNPAKRHTMYDINEPDITYEYPTQAGEQVDYNDYAEQDTRPISIGKRYLGALARNGWLPRGFAALRSQNSNPPNSFEKKHIGSLAQTGWLPTVRTAALSSKPAEYYHYNNLRNDRQREFRPPLYRGPRAFFSQSKPEAKTKTASCKCKRESVDPASGATSFARTDLGDELGQITSSAASASTGDVSTGEGTRLLSKRRQVLEPADYYLPYPQTSSEQFATDHVQRLPSYQNHGLPTGQRELLLRIIRTTNAL